MSKDLQIEVKKISDKFLELKEKSPALFLQYLPDFLLDIYIIGIGKKFGIEERRPISFWHNILEKNEKIKYNYRKILLGCIVFLLGNYFFKIKKEY